MMKKKGKNIKRTSVMWGWGGVGWGGGGGDEFRGLVGNYGFREIEGPTSNY